MPGRTELDSYFKHTTAKAARIGFYALLVILVAFSLFLPSSFLAKPARAVPAEEDVRETVDELNFLSSTRKENLTLSILAGAKDALLNYQSELGTKTLMKALDKQETSSENKDEFLDAYNRALREDLPVFLINKTSIRLLRTGAPFDTVLSKVKAQIDLLRQVERYLEREELDLYLTHEDRTLLVDALAESVVTYSRRTGKGDFEVSDEKIDELRRTTENMVKFSSLPVSLQGGTKGGTGGEGTNPQLTEFIRDERTIKKLAELAREFNRPKE